MDEIYTFSRSSDTWTKARVRVYSDSVFVFGESVRSFRSESEMGKIELKTFDSPILTGNYLELMENRLSLSGKFSHVRHWRSSRGSMKTCKIEILSLRISKIESPSCQCSMTSDGQREKFQKNVSQIPNKSRSTQKYFRKDTGHSSALETKRSGMELSVRHLKENGIPQPHKWWNDSKKVTQYSRASLL